MKLGTALMFPAGAPDSEAFVLFRPGIHPPEILQKRGNHVKKKILSLALALAVCLGLSVPALAAEPADLPFTGIAADSPIGTPSHGRWSRVSPTAPAKPPSPLQTSAPEARSSPSCTAITTCNTASKGSPQAVKPPAAYTLGNIHPGLRADGLHPPEKVAFPLFLWVFPLSQRNGGAQIFQKFCRKGDKRPAM